jgi:ABC-type uncharacterized transport system substrate-binding protein
MLRREFIAGLGSAAAWPAVVRGQQPTIPVIGFLDTGRHMEAGQTRIGASFRLGLREQGYVDGRTVEILHRYAETQYDRLPVLASDLVRQRVPLIVAAGGSAPALAAKSATTTIPIEIAARKLGVLLAILRAGNASETYAVFGNLSEQGIGALLVDADPLFYDERNRVAVLTERAAVPAIYRVREIVEAGGLVSYGANLSDVFRLVGDYAGRILKGEKPADLPVMQPTKFELVINLKTAKTLGLTLPETLLATADEVIQ